MREILVLTIARTLNFWKEEILRLCKVMMLVLGMGGTLLLSGLWAYHVHYHLWAGLLQMSCIFMFWLVGLTFIYNFHEARHTVNSRHRVSTFRKEIDQLILDCEEMNRVWSKEESDGQDS